MNQGKCGGPSHLGRCGGGLCGRGCSAVLLLGGNRPLAIVGVLLLANLR